MSAIDQLMVTPGADTYYSDDFHNVLEDHMTYLRGLASTTKQEVEPIDVIRYQADFFGLLGRLGVPQYLHWVVLRMTGLTSPAKVPLDLAFVLVPDISDVQRLQQTIKTTAQIQK